MNKISSMIFIHYLKIGLRQIQRNRITTTTNISGLAIGIACCILIYLYVYDELLFDKYIPNKDCLYRIYGNNFGGNEWMSNQPARLLPYIKEKLPEIEMGTRIMTGDRQIATENKIFNEVNFVCTDTSIFKVLGWKLVVGNPHKALSYSKYAVISESTAKKYFGNNNPVGKDLFVNNYDHFTVTGVFRDIQKQSTVRANIIVPDSSFLNNQWGNFSSEIYVRLNKKTNIPELEKKLSNLWNNIEGREGGVGNAQLKLQLVEDIHLKSGHIVQFDKSRYGSIYNVIGFSITGLLILIIACFNYVNFFTARAQLRGIEVGIRKTGGARRLQIIVQFLVEGALQVIVAIGVALIISEFFLPYINKLIDKELSLYHSEAHILLFLTAIAFFTVIGAGLYPSLMMSGFAPVSVLKNVTDFDLGKKHSFKIPQEQIRQILVSFQFFIVISLIIFVVVVAKQINYIKDFDSGYSKERILLIDNRNGTFKELHHRYQFIKEQAKKIQGVEIVTSTSNVPVRGMNNYGFPYFIEYPQNRVGNIGYVTADWEYLQCINVEIIEGRYFDPSIPSDSNAVILDESYVKQVGIVNPVGMIMDGFWDNQRRIVIGIVKDIYFNDLHRPKNSSIIMLKHKWLNNDRMIVIKTRTNDFNVLIKKIRKIWNEAAPEWTFQYAFLNDEFMDSFKKERNTAQLMNIFAFISILLSVSGLAGLVLFSVQKGTKEIGIRKAHGASIFNIILRVSLWHLKPIGFAILFAFPFTYMVLQYWLNNFANKIDISWWIFLLSALLTTILALVTICVQSWQAANRNPVESLRYE
jgi:putative ABC transport system permease protein